MKSIGHRTYVKNRLSATQYTVDGRSDVATKATFLNTLPITHCFPEQKGKKNYLHISKV